jgi:hypothetical protein
LDTFQTRENRRFLDSKRARQARVINVAQETNRHRGTLGGEQNRLIDRLRNEPALG